MKGYQSTFKRYEMKYLLDEDKLRQIRQRLRCRNGNLEISCGSVISSSDEL